MKGAVTYRFVSRPTPADANGIITIYKAQGWWRRATRARLDRLIRGSLCFVVAERDGRIIGMGRAIGDGVSDAYLQDIAVLKCERGAGAGAGMVRALTRRLRRGGVRWIALIAQDGSEPFYSGLGFTRLKNAAPMLIKGARV
ncbi:MAG: GNAT family N-acetyltransferase [Elusimicrobiales bacterium]